MVKSCFSAAMLAVVIILLSLEADAQPTSASTLDEVVDMVKMIASNQQENSKEIKQVKKEVTGDEVKNEVRDVKSLLVSGSVETRLDEIKDEIKAKIADEIRDVKQAIESECKETNQTSLDEVVNIVKMIASNQQQNAEEIRDLKKLIALMPIMIHYDAAEPSEHAVISALVSNCTPLLIQQNVDGSNFFNRSWAEFRVGFGDPSGNYWLGNELLSQLTASDRYKLRFDLQARHNGNWYYAEYSTFRVLTEADNYKLLVAGYSGNASHDAFSYQNGMQFSTYDRDNDPHSSRNCAVQAGGGFWYKNCYHCGVNAAGRGSWDFRWAGLPGGSYLQTSRMWLQCK